MGAPLSSYLHCRFAGASDNYMTPIYAANALYRQLRKSQTKKKILQVFKRKDNIDNTTEEREVHHP